MFICLLRWQLVLNSSFLRKIFQSPFFPYQQVFLLVLTFPLHFIIFYGKKYNLGKMFRKPYVMSIRFYIPISPVAGPVGAWFIWSISKNRIFIILFSLSSSTVDVQLIKCEIEMRTTQHTTSITIKWERKRKQY